MSFSSCKPPQALEGKLFARISRKSARLTQYAKNTIDREKARKIHAANGYGGRKKETLKKRPGSEDILAGKGSDWNHTGFQAMQEMKTDSDLLINGSSNVSVRLDRIFLSLNFFMITIIIHAEDMQSR